MEGEQERRPRKRPKFAWDVPPRHITEAQPIVVSNGVNLQTQIGISFACPKAGSGLEQRPPSPPWRQDDKDGHYVFELGENLTPRYKILSKMGEGTFGRVLECWDREAKEVVAVKIIRGIQKYRNAAMVEIDILSALARHVKSSTRCVQIRNWFDFRNHICIVCEKLGPSLYDFLRKNRYRPCPVSLVREFGKQLLESVADYIKVPLIKKRSQDEMQYKHLPKSSAIKLIDFGSTTVDNRDHTSVVSTRHYRAPEVILGLGWTYPCDIWSVGCILVELCSGEALFQTHENLEHLAMMERVLGPLPQHMIKNADQRFGKYFKWGKRLNWPEGAASRESIRSVQKLSSLKSIVMKHADRSVSVFTNLLEGLLKFEPTERLTAQEALNHVFFKENC
eukprot:TRINITY_DN5584_c0_g1_i6.p1 TRINITY_DN5584_c0_g1~~TRINITY_DN5584_c0_g1_i6.p1  ORF type:complete len:393 (-),score=43.28 TRINITY_DN5584_c0_g1_i6:159-1337(-)